MNRIEFSQQLIVQRESAGIGKNELCRLTGFTFNQLQYLEKASNNYNINLVCTYLAAIKSKMVLLKGKKRKVICDFEGFADWMTSTRKLEYTQRALADKELSHTAPFIGLVVISYFLFGVEFTQYHREQVVVDVIEYIGYQ